jgi:hypothetical protein
VTCAAPDCDREAKRRGLCSGHRWQREHGRALTPLRTRYGSAWERLQAAMLAYSDAETDEAFESAKARCKAAARAWLRSMGTPAGPSCRQRADGRWECRVRVAGKRLSFYGADRAEAREKAVAATPTETD